MPIRNHMRITAAALALAVGLTGGAQAEPFNIFSVSKAAEKADGAPQLDQVQYRRGFRGGGFRGGGFRGGYGYRRGFYGRRGFGFGGAGLGLGLGVGLLAGAAIASNRYYCDPYYDYYCGGYGYGPGYGYGGYGGYYGGPYYGGPGFYGGRRFYRRYW